MNYLIGVDGGGSKTEVVVTNDRGKVISLVYGEASNPNDIGKESAVSVIVGLIKKALPKDCKTLKIGLGISGLAVANAEDYFRTRLLAELPCVKDVVAYSDKISCLNCAHDGDGCVMIIGTGRPIDEVSAASNHRNKDTISIEVCHPDATGKFNQETYASLVKLTAWLCDNSDLKKENIIRHYDVTGKYCPLYFVEHEDEWETFKSDVENEMEKLRG